MEGASVLQWSVASTGLSRPAAGLRLSSARVALAGSLLAHAVAFALLPPFSAWRVEPPAAPASLSVTLGPAAKAPLAAINPAARPLPQLAAPAKPMPAHAIPAPLAHVTSPRPLVPPLLAAVGAPATTSISVAPVVESRPALASEAVAPASAKAAVATDRGDEVSPARVDPAWRSQYKAPYPLSARRRNIEGTVTLHVEVLPNGDAGQVEILHSSGDDALDNSARDSAHHWRFTPAQKGGKPVVGWVRVPYQFNLDD